MSTYSPLFSVNTLPIAVSITLCTDFLISIFILTITKPAVIIIIICSVKNVVQTSGKKLLNQNNVSLLNSVKAGFHMSRKSQTIGDSLFSDRPRFC